jgi:peptidoglycan/LPS O-acetylase OafA/YrhL
VSSSTSFPAPVRRIVGLEGLRGLAVLAVVTGNGVVLLGSPGTGSGAVDRPLVAAGLCGLALLFVLSGFLLFRPYVAALVRGRDLPGSRDFYRTRLLRVAPAWSVVLLFILALGVPIGGVGGGVDEAPALRAVLVTSWSLAALVGCYLLLPVLVLLADGLARWRGGVWASACVALLLLGVGLAARVGLLVTTDRRLPAVTAEKPWYDALANSFAANADLFAMGMVVAVIMVAAREWLYSDEAIRRMRRAGAAMMLLSSLGFIAYVEPIEAGPFFGLACAGLLVYLTLPARRASRRRTLRVLESAPLRWLGRVSYSAWLWHVPLLCFLAWRFDWMVAQAPGELLVRVGAVTAVTLLLAYLTQRFVEAPARVRGRRTRGGRGQGTLLPHQRTELRPGTGVLDVRQSQPVD